MKSRGLKRSKMTNGYDVPPHVLGVPVVVDIDTRLPARAAGVWPFKKIVVGENWFYLERREKEAVLMHEACHCLKLHMEKRILAMPCLLIDPQVNIRLAIAQEHEADEFAARAGYGVELLSALKKFGGETGLFYPTFAARSERIGDAIREMSHV